VDTALQGSPSRMAKDEKDDGEDDQQRAASGDDHSPK
jgi:hypothetical protein